MMTITSNRVPIERWPVFRRILPYGILKNGYKVNPEDPLELLPDEDLIVLWEQGFDYLDNGSSLREVSEWIAPKIGRAVTHTTVAKLYRVHRKPYVKKTEKATKPKQTKEHIQKRVAKNNVHRAIKKVAQLEQDKVKKAKRLQPEDFPEGRREKPPAPIFGETSDPVNVIFRPNPGPQTEFLGATETQVLYGGAAGGGKSYAMLADPMRYFDNPRFAGLLLRRTNDELRELKRESQLIYPKCFPGAVWKEKDSMWVFPSGATFWMTYLERDDDVLRYQGQSFCWIGMDELTQYPTPYAWNYLSSRLRSSDPELEKSLSMRATTNPGGPGHHWVKKMFIDPAPPGETFWATDITTGDVLVYPDDEEDESLRGKPLMKRKFIPAKLSDNPHLAKSGLYKRNLLTLPQEQQRKLLYGDWDIVEGAAFAEFNPRNHVTKPFDIPSDWRKFRAADYGYTSPSCVLWFAIDPSYDTLYVYRELYQKGLTGRALAEKVLEMERGEDISYGILDSSVWHNRGHTGPTVAEEMIAYGCRWRPSDRGAGSRSAGKNRLHELLKITEDEDEKPITGIKFFETCRQLIADLPSLPQDPGGEDDIDPKSPNDHSYDALRYGIMSRPRTQSPLDWGKTVITYRPADPVFGY